MRPEGVSPIWIFKSIFGRSQNNFYLNFLLDKKTPIVLKLGMKITELLQEHLDVFKDALTEIRDLKKQVKDLKKQLRASKTSRTFLAKQNKTLQMSGEVLDGVDEDRLFELEATLSFQRSLDGLRILKVRSLNLGMEMHTSQEGPILQQGVRKSLGRIECPVEA